MGVADSDLERLAKSLTVRHLRISVPDLEVRQEIQQGRTREPWLEQQVRCIALVGAGASHPLLKRGHDLAAQLETQFMAHDEARKAELFRLHRVYGLDASHFETRLAALSQLPHAETIVREAIANQYRVRHPTIAGYELLAHLLKHRFIDAIVTFNFDELLDQSLDDELGPGEYRRLVSDRDRIGVEVNPSAPLYKPLYVKLHGTAAEPESLRFTRDAYYRLPTGLSAIMKGFLECQHCTVVNIGSGMDGLDLHRFLRIPQRLEVHDLSYLSITDRVRQEISRERIHPQGDSLYPSARRAEPEFFLHRRGPKHTCDEWLESLVRTITNGVGRKADPRSVASLVQFRSVIRHEAVASILGPDEMLERWTRDPSQNHGDYVEYLRQRTVLELAFSGAKARGLAQLSWLAVDRCGVYYDLYRSEGAAASEGWRELRNAAGLVENDWLPDVVESQPDLCPPGSPKTLEDGLWTLREFDTNALAEHVLAQLGRSGAESQATLEMALTELQIGSEVEIYATDDKVCRKAFRNPLPLPTTTALSIYTKRILTGLKASDRIYISCETGEWLLHDDSLTELLMPQEHVEVITAFDVKYSDLNARYGGRLKQFRLDPWRHNRHMTVVCRGHTPWRAVYFARRLRTPLITPVYLRDPEDAARVMRAWELMRYEATEVEATSLSTSAEVTDARALPLREPGE